MRFESTLKAFLASVSGIMGITQMIQERVAYAIKEIRKMVVSAITLLFGVFFLIWGFAQFVDTFLANNGLGYAFTGLILIIIAFIIGRKS